jgi:hypothetical protein
MGGLYIRLSRSLQAYKADSVSADADRIVPSTEKPLENQGKLNIPIRIKVSEIAQTSPIQRVL